MTGPADPSAKSFAGTRYYYYNKKRQMLESRDGSENLDMQVIYGIQYVDERLRLFRQRLTSILITCERHR